MIDTTSELLDRIQSLKTRYNAVILAHNYQLGEIQDLADIIGDSLELSRAAAETNADVIVFCGVYFMAETAYILSPTKTVLLPDEQCGCPMADMLNAEQLRRFKETLPGLPVVCYVNSSAEVKAGSDICCTSSNAASVVNSIGAEEMIFVPDKYLGNYVAGQTGKKLHLWPGYCPTHARILPEYILRLKKEFPKAKVAVHPECRPEVIALADATLSTGGIIRYAEQPDVKQLIVGTEIGIIHRLRKNNPDKLFIPVSEQAICPNMKQITLEKVVWSLEEMAPRVTVVEDIRRRALKAVECMLEVT